MADRLTEADLDSVLSRIASEVFMRPRLGGLYDDVVKLVAEVRSLRGMMAAEDELRGRAWEKE